MAIIVVHKESGNEFILLGSSYSFYKDSRPSFFGGNLIPHEEEGEASLVAVCDENGVITWFPTEDVLVVEVDGVTVSNVFETLKQRKSLRDNRPWGNDEKTESCPGCGELVREFEKVCPSCGLTLIADFSEDL